MALRQVLYTSQAGNDVDETVCAEILRASHVNNPREALTGFLVFLINGTFLQILEGPETGVEKALRRIASDARHTAMAIIFDHEIDERSFPDWTMGFRALHPEELGRGAGFHALNNIEDYEILFADGPKVLRLIRSICYTNNRWTGGLRN